MKRAALYLMLALAAPPAVSAAGELSLGLGYPYLSAKYDIGGYAAEARLAAGGGIQAYSGRGYWKFHRAGQLTGFAGLEAGYINFNTLLMQGSGGEFALFAGGEYAVTENFSVLMDFAPTLIVLNHQTYDVGVSGVEYVVNLGFYYRFGAGGGRPARQPAPRPASPAPHMQRPPAPKPPQAPPPADIPEAPPPAEPAPAPAPAPALAPASAPARPHPVQPAPQHRPQPKPAPAATPAEENEAKFALQDLDHPDWRIRRKAVLSLGMLKYAPAAPRLMRLLGDDNAKVRGMTALTLGSIGDPRAVTPLLHAIEDGDPYVRASAAEALGVFGERRALPALQKALGDGDPTVSKAAANSIERINSAR